MTAIKGHPHAGIIRRTGSHGAQHILGPVSRHDHAAGNPPLGQELHCGHRVVTARDGDFRQTLTQPAGKQRCREHQSDRREVHRPAADAASERVRGEPQAFPCRLQMSGQPVEHKNHQEREVTLVRERLIQNQRQHHANHQVPGPPRAEPCPGEQREHQPELRRIGSPQVHRMPLRDFRTRRRDVVEQPGMQPCTVGIRERRQDRDGSQQQQVPEQMAVPGRPAADELGHASDDDCQEDAETGQKTAVRVGPEHHDGRHQPEASQTGLQFPRVVQRPCGLSGEETGGAVLIRAVTRGREIVTRPHRFAPRPAPGGPPGEATVGPSDQGCKQRERQHMGPQPPVAGKIPSRDRSEDEQRQGMQASTQASAQPLGNHQAAQQALQHQQAGDTGTIHQRREQQFAQILMVHPRIVGRGVGVGRGRGEPMPPSVPTILNVAPEVRIDALGRQGDQAPAPESDEKDASATQQGTSRAALRKSRHLRVHGERVSCGTEPELGRVGLANGGAPVATSGGDRHAVDATAPAAIEV